MSPVLSSLEGAVQVVTTTIFSPGPSSTPASHPSTSAKSTVPFASIIGGSAAGVLLAITAVVGWRLWGRSIKRKNERLRREALSKYTTRENTRRNASMSAPNISSPHTFAAPQERKVKFAFLSTSEKDMDRTAEPLDPSDLFFPPSLPKRGDHRSLSAAAQETRPFLPATAPPHIDSTSWPSSPPSVPEPSSVPSTASVPPPFLRSPASLAHKASNPSTLSLYSTQSGEAHQTRVPGYFLARKFDPKRLSNLTRSTRTGSQYSVLNDVTEHPPKTAQEYRR